jgi:hypothetical protein
MMSGYTNASEMRRDAAYREQMSLFDAPMPTSAAQSVANVAHVAKHDAGTAAESSGYVPEDHGKASRDETYREVKSHHDSDRMIWLCRIVAKGRHGATLDELAAEFGVEASSFSGRITELKERRLVVHTAERRPTRKGKTASVIVAIDFVKGEAGFHDPKRGGEMVTTERTNYMPDQLTCTGVPVDQYGDAIRDGRVYMINNARVQCFESEGSLYVQKVLRRDVPVDGSRPQLVGELPAAVKIERV